MCDEDWRIHTVDMDDILLLHSAAFVCLPELHLLMPTVPSGTAGSVLPMHSCRCRGVGDTPGNARGLDDQKTVVLLCTGAASLPGLHPAASTRMSCAGAVYGPIKADRDARVGQMTDDYS